MKKLFVGGISWDAKDEDLTEFFGRYGAVTEAKIITDRDTGRSRGFGFVTFENEDDAAQAKADDGAEMMGRTLRIDFAQSQRNGGGGGGNSHHKNKGGGKGGGGRDGGKSGGPRRRRGREEQDFR